MPTPSGFNAYQLAFRAWPILVERAKQHRPITYGQLAAALGIHHRPVKYVLSEIQDHCLREKLPPLTILVEDQKGHVGRGFIAWDADDFETGRDLVYREAWSNRPNPFGFAADGSTPDDIATAINAGSTSPAAAFALVRQRGMAQVIFRKTMLLVYAGQCAFCGHRGHPILQAAHIIPWGKATPDQRLDPTNGILLCVLHHRMFDLNWLRIDEDFRIGVNWPTIIPNGISSDQHRALSSLDGKPIVLPSDKRHWPSKDLIAKRCSDGKILHELRPSNDQK